eukprot:COSAG06_NODE_39625_length_410_cov_1.299035_1_plen_25_part_10
MLLGYDTLGALGYVEGGNAMMRGTV